MQIYFSIQERTYLILCLAKKTVLPQNTKDLMTHLCHYNFGIASGHRKKAFFLWGIPLILQAGWMFPLTTCPHCTSLMPHSAVIKCVSIIFWILFEKPAHLSSSLRFALHGHLAIGGQAELYPALSPAILAPLIPQVQIMAGCQHGTLRPEPSWCLDHLPSRPNKTFSWDTCDNKNWSQQFLQECKQKGYNCDRTQLRLRFHRIGRKLAVF